MMTPASRLCSVPSADQFWLLTRTVGAVHDDALVVHVLLDLDVVDHVQAHGAELLEVAHRLELAHDDLDVHAVGLPVDDRVDQVDERLRRRVARLGRLDVLELHVERPGGAGDERGDRARVHAGIGGQQRGDLDRPADRGGGEELRRRPGSGCCPGTAASAAGPPPRAGCCGPTRPAGRCGCNPRTPRPAGAAPRPRASPGRGAAPAARRPGRGPGRCRAGWSCSSSRWRARTPRGPGPRP